MKKLLILLLISSLLSWSFAQGTTPEAEVTPDIEMDTLAEGLILHLPLDEAVKDIIENEFDIRVNGGEFVPDRFDNEMGAFLLDGEDDYIRIADSDLLDLEEALTLSFWIFFEEQATTTWYTVFEKTGPADGHARYGFWVIRDLAEMCIEPASNAPRVGPQMCFDSEVSLNLEEWNHVVGTYDGQTIAITINGEDAGTLERPQPDGISTTDAPLYNQWCGFTD